MDPLTVLIVIAGLVFLGYAFSQIFSSNRPDNPLVRFMTISLMVLVGLLLANRLLSPSLTPGLRGSSELLPREFPGFGRLQAPAQTGWQVLPDAILRSLLSDVIDGGSGSQSPIPPSPSPAPGVLPTPVLPSTPTPTPLPTPILPTPVPSPSPPPVSPILPTPTPTPTPILPTPTPPPTPTLPPILPTPVPSPNPPPVAPQPPRRPIPAWW